MAGDPVVLDAVSSSAVTGNEVRTGGVLTRRAALWVSLILRLLLNVVVSVCNGNLAGEMSMGPPSMKSMNRAVGFDSILRVGAGAVRCVRVILGRIRVIDWRLYMVLKKKGMRIDF